VAPGIWRYLWLLIGLLGMAGILTWTVPVPVYVSGSAVIVAPATAAEEMVVVAFLPAAALARLQVGQPLFLPIDVSGMRLQQPITVVESTLFSPQAAQRRFNPNHEAALEISQPVAVAIAPFVPPASDLPAATYASTVSPVDVQIGTRRLLSLLPLVGHFFDT
jgi:hypothetical protein